MLSVSAEDTARALNFDALIPALREGFVRDAHTPNRHHHAIDGSSDATLLLMPSWTEGGYLGVKLVNVFPANSEAGQPALSSVYILASAVTGEHLAVLDGNELTRRRTTGTAALGASYLARSDSAVLLIVGAGHIGSVAAEAYAAVRDIRTVLVYNRTAAVAEQLVAELGQRGMPAKQVTDLSAAVPEADIISCATLATEPIISGELLRPGTHIDLIGSFRPTMREVDDECIRRATVYIDSPVAFEEAGDIAQPVAAGVLDPAAVAGTLPELCRGELAGREHDDQITVFKTVGTGLADLAAATLVYRSVR
ncbi:ornithine cyclodeaminase [Tamaricihabitans halophyticus]|uniref:Ornithine cyclodeaminase n=1 Tax=Tamaricihabitans halophyticus TaxID=1262583 RepID=A0A4V2SUL2_9PSEU|nr:ornithine cyclodeaminase family protein [Tamaricihabitans halophyticus]TCP55016.1 ornithine cyclodeaminase [Tamaricihabitans halophyticus]